MNLEHTNCPACGANDVKHFQSTKTMMAPQTEEWNFDQCTKCHMVYLNPRVSIENIDLFYNEEYLPYRGGAAWGKYESLVDGDQKKVDQKRVETINEYAHSNAKNILDVGCGKPTFLNRVRSQKKIDCTGIDFSDHGWSSQKNLYKGINLIVGEMGQLPPKSTYDLITMWQYMEHDYHPYDTLQTLLNHSHDHTRLIIEVPCIDSSSRKAYGEHWAGYHSPRHTGLYTPKTMQVLLDRSGWDVVDSYTYGTLDPYVLDWMSRMEQQGIDWTSSMQSKFVGFVTGKIVRPNYFLHKSRSQGFMTVIASPK